MAFDLHTPICDLLGCEHPVVLAGMGGEGAPVRVLPNSVTRGERGDPFSGARTVIGDEEGRPIYLFSTDSPLRSMTGDFEAMALYAGQGAGRIDAIIPAGDRLRAIVAEA